MASHLNIHSKFTIANQLASYTVTSFIVHPTGNAYVQQGKILIYVVREEIWDTKVSKIMDLNFEEY